MQEHTQQKLNGDSTNKKHVKTRQEGRATLKGTTRDYERLALKDSRLKSQTKENSKGANEARMVDRAIQTDAPVNSHLNQIFGISSKDQGQGGRSETTKSFRKASSRQADAQTLRDSDDACSTPSTQLARELNLLCH